MKIIVPDNLREGVLKPDIYDPTLNPLYRDVLAHNSAASFAFNSGSDSGLVQLQGLESSQALRFNEIANRSVKFYKDGSVNPSNGD